MGGAAGKWEAGSNLNNENMLAPHQRPQVLTDGFHHQTPFRHPGCRAVQQRQKCRMPAHVTCLRGHHSRGARAGVLSTMSRPCGHESPLQCTHSKASLPLISRLPERSPASFILSQGSAFPVHGHRITVLYIMHVPVCMMLTYRRTGMLHACCAACALTSHCLTVT